MSRERDDDIGYGKPPRYTRFSKGKSGNPKGRPRKAKPPSVPKATSYEQMLEKLYGRELLVKIDGKNKKITAIEAIALRQQAAALAGGHMAMRDTMREKRRLDEQAAERALLAEEERVVMEAQKAEDDLRFYHHLVELHAKQVSVYGNAKSAQTDPERPYPHPDDFVFDHSAKQAFIHGPWDEVDALHYRKLAKERDYHCVHYIILCRQRPQGTAFDQSLSLSMMVSYDSMLPKRMRLLGKSSAQALEMIFMLPMADLRDWRRQLSYWHKLNPWPELDKKSRKEVYKSVNAAMKPFLKPLGFRSVAQLEHHCEKESEASRKLLPRVP